jgi:hypothetical protein
MSVLRRKMFGGGYAHRGTGITSGLTTPRRGYVDRPGSYQGNGEASLPSDVDDKWKEKWQAYYDMLKGVQGERAPFDRFDANVEPLMTLFGNLMSGTSYQGGLGGALEIGGKGLTEAAPGFGKAIREKRAYEAATGTEDAALRMKALDLALKETDPVELKSFEPIYGEFQNEGDEPQIGYGFVKAYDNGDIEYEFAGEQFTSFKGKAEPAENKPETFFKGEQIKIRKRAGVDRFGRAIPAGESFEAILQTGNRGSIKYSGIGKKSGDFNSDEYEIFNEDGNFDFEGNIKIKRTGSEIIEDATQVFNKDTGNIETRLTDGTVLKNKTFDIIEFDAGKKDVYAQKPYKVVINGKTYDTTARQEGRETFIIDPIEGSDTQGQFVNIKEIEDIESLFETQKAEFRSVEEELEILRRGGNIEQVSKAASSVYDKIIADGAIADKGISNYITAEQILDTATSSSYAPQRFGFMKFLEAFEVDENLPGMFKAAEAALNTGKTVSSEVANALAQNAFIANAQAYDDRLNNTEVKKLEGADFGIGMSTQGSKLLIKINKANDQILSNGADIARNLTMGTEGGAKAIIEKYGDILGPEVVEKIKTLSAKYEGESLSMADAVLIADNYMSKAFQEFGNNEELSKEIDAALNISSVGDQAYFNELGDRDMGETGVTINLGEAYKNKQILFAGYPMNGEFIYDDQQQTTTGFDDSRPMYIIFFEINGVRQRAVTQFPDLGQ